MDITTRQLATYFAPQLPGVDLTRVVILTQSIVVHLTSTVKQAACPHCQHPSTSRHSRYTRTLADVPWGTYTVRVLLTVRKFRCWNRTCAQRVFTEQLPEIVAPYARQTRRCQDVLRAIGLALGGQAGARLAADLALPTSRDGLLRLIRATPLPTYAAPRVVGIDDWARRRGRQFGTIVVDLERQQPLALLPDRQPETVIAWLQRHPTITVVSRDRADGYAEAIRRGAPQAQQIADRWHLLKNLTEVLEAWLPNHRVALEAAVTPPTAPPIDLTTVPVPVGATEAGDAIGQQRQSRYREQDEQIHRLHAQHLETATIARQVGVSRMTVYKYLHLTEPPLGKQPGTRVARMLAPYQPYLLQRWSAGCRNAQQLAREIIAQGYQGSIRTVNRYLTELRRACGEKSRSFRDAARQDLQTVHQKARRVRPPTIKQIALLFTARNQARSADQRAYLTRLCAQNPEIATTYQLVQRFTAMVRERTGHQLEQWLTDVLASTATPLRRFAQGIQRDQAAVQAGLTERWSQGQVEGQISRLKF